MRAARMVCVLTVSLATGAARAAPSFDELLGKLEDADRRLPAERFDLDAVVARAGADPAKLLAWVERETDWVPYRGSLRGALGVLLDGSGNSLDRALLLGELARRSGRTVRLAHAELDAGQAARLLAALRPRPARPAQPPLGGKLARLDEARARVVAQTALLARLVPAPASRGPDPAPAAMRDHWWVQVADGERWLDLDPLHAGAKAATTVDLGADPPAVPAHELTLRVIVESSEGATRREAVALAETLRPAELVGVPIVLRTGAVDFPEGLDLETGGLARADEVIKASRIWLPALAIGDRIVAQHAFTDAGELTDDLPADPAAAAGGAVAGGFGGLGGGLAGGPAPASARPPGRGTLTAVWLEVELRAPDRPARTIRREILDLVGPARRQAHAALPALGDAERRARGWALMTEIRLLAQTGRVSPLWLAHRTIQAWLAARGDLGSDTPSDDRALGLVPPDGRVLAVAAQREALAPGGPSAIIDGVNVLCDRVELAPSGAELVLRRRFDLVNNDVGDGFAVRLGQGVADSVAETLPVGGGAGESTSEAFVAAQARGLAPVVVRDPGGLAALSLSPDVRARAAADLAAGYVLVVTAKPVVVAGVPRTAWWRIDPRTGETLGVMESGFHQALTEEKALALVRRALDVYASFLKLPMQRVLSLTALPLARRIQILMDMRREVQNLLVDVVEYWKDPVALADLKNLLQLELVYIDEWLATLGAKP